MLVLSRKRDESIVVVTPLGEKFIFKIIEVIGNRAKVGVEAPKSFRVHRAELAESLEWAKRGAK